MDNQLPVLCPHCGNGLIAVNSGTSCAVCQACCAQFARSNGVLDLLGDKAVALSPASRTMLWKWLVAIYNGPLWRKSKVFAWFMGTTFAQEYAIIEQSAHLTGQEIVLDLACGPGTYTLPFARKLPKGFVVGLDISRPMLEQGAANAKANQINNVLFIRTQVEDLPFPKRQFDVVNCCGALHLFAHLPLVLTKVQAMLRPGGTFTLGAARRKEGDFFQRLTASIRKTTGLRCFTQQEMLNLLEQAGFEQIKCYHAKGVWLIMSAQAPI